jgi:hypothetical protein
MRSGYNFLAEFARTPNLLSLRKRAALKTVHVSDFWKMSRILYRIVLNLVQHYNFVDTCYKFRKEAINIKEYYFI